MNRKNLTRLLTLMTVLCLLFTACSGGGGTSTTPSGGTEPTSDSPTASGDGGAASSGGSFLFAIGTEPTTLDPHLVNDTATARAEMQIFEPLVKRDQTSAIQPWLAESWTTSEDGLTWTFSLRQDVRFTDGTPFNAEAVVYNIERLQHPDTAAPKASVVDMVGRVEAVDEYTVSFHLNAPCSVFLAQISSYTCAMLSPTAAEEHGSSFGQNPVGTGPLKLESWDYGSSLTMVANSDYWGNPPTVDSVVFRVVPEDASRVMMLKTGDADVVAGIPPIQIADLETDSSVRVLEETGYRTIFIGMNSTITPLDDVHVRQAVNYAINREAIIDNVLRGVAEYPSSFMVSNVIDNSAQGLGCYEYDIEKAKELLADAGYAGGFSLKLNTPEGRYPMDRQVAEVIQAMLAEVNITAEINVLDWGAYQEQANSGQNELFLLGMGCPTGDPEFNLYMNFGTTGPQNYSRFSNETVDRLLDEQILIMDTDERYQVMYSIQEELKNDACAAPLYYEKQLFGSRADVEGFIIYPDEIVNIAYLVRN